MTRAEFFLSSLLLCGCTGVEPMHARSPEGTGAASVIKNRPLESRTLEVAVTVDDLPSHGPLLSGMTRLDIAEDMLRIFAAHRVPGVYGFVNGKKVESDPETEAVLLAWTNAGHPLGNHAWSHPNLDRTPLDVYLQDIAKNEEVLARHSAGQDWHFFRYPFLHEGGTVDKRTGVREFLSGRGYAIAEVSIDANDWAFNAPYVRCAQRGDVVQMASLRERFVSEHVDELRRMRELGQKLVQRDFRHVLMLHLGVADVAALDALLTAYEKEGVRWIDLSTALADSFYSIDPATPLPAGPAFPYLVAKARGITEPAPVYARQLEDELAHTCIN